MTAALTALAVVAALPVALPLLVFTAEVWAGLRPIGRAAASGVRPTSAVLVPAHDEATGIAATVGSVRADGAALDVLVVADNCSDDTAAVARAAGARVVERHDPVRRGKGYALAFGRDALAADPPDCVVVLDADCTMSGAEVAGLAAQAVEAGRAVQARNLQRPRLGARGTSAISDFAFVVKNLVRQQGAMRCGGVAVLTGTGMAIPWAAMADAPLATSALAEDLALGIWLTRQGRPPLYAPIATVWSDAASGADLLTQRRRWEHGFLAAARRNALPLLVDGIARRSRSTTWLALHLLVPPLALLVAAAGVALMLTVALAVAGASWWPSAVLALLGAGAAGGVVAAWSRYGRDQIGLGAVLAIPRYIAAKLPGYRLLARRGQAEWKRTRRAGEE